MNVAFPVTYFDGGITRQLFQGYAERVDVAKCRVLKDGTLLLWSEEGVNWVHGHYTAAADEVKALLSFRALRDS